MALSASVNDWVKEQLADSKCEEIRDKKIIRDAVLDTNRFCEYEVNILDLPILQRLRRISQTGFSYFLYPSSTHNRFEHTLGVTVIATKFARALNRKEKKSHLMDDRTIHEIRMAAILHDVGHGPFSHLSERVYSHFPEIDHLRKKDQKFSKASAKPHEILSYMITTSKAFQDFFQENLNDKQYAPRINLNNIANMIVGNMDDPGDAYLADIINGSFDADKLDYIPRDCYFTGLKMDVDIDRIMYTISIDKKRTAGRRGLMIDIGGAPFVEQILFNKMMLYTSLYHHHKVRALECMFASIFEICHDYKLKINGLSFDKEIDFLSVTDMELLTLNGKPDEIKPYIQNIRNRELLKRAFVISKSTIKKLDDMSEKEADDDVDLHYQTLMSYREDPKILRAIREAIVQEVGNGLTYYDLWIDLPEPPSFNEPSRTVINITDDDRRTLDKIFRVNLWLTGYAENKWRGHIFCPPTYKKIVGETALKVLKRDYGIEFNKYAILFAK